LEQKWIVRLGNLIPLKPQECRVKAEEGTGTSNLPIRYVKCNQCGRDMEIWSDEDVGICLECGSSWVEEE
jgi:hypothetical protein